MGMAKPMFACVPAIVPARKNSDKSQSSLAPTASCRYEPSPLAQPVGARSKRQAEPEPGRGRVVGHRLRF